ncbi:MAG: transposase [Betaproteobacteria bacterium]|nr:transposase [Betaproteobacteria bacterium]
MANANLYVMRFRGLSLEHDVPDHSVLSRFRTRLTTDTRWVKPGIFCRLWHIT